MKLSSRSTAAILALILLLADRVDAQNNTYPFAVKKSGQGAKSIIFIPGFASSGDVWNETKATFENEFTCYTLTMAGFAGIPPQQQPTFKNWENSIARYIKDKNIEKPVIIGHSLGGGLALALASDYPQLIDKIVVVDALPCLAAMMNPMFTAAEKPDCSVMVNQVTSATQEQFNQMQKQSAQRLVADTAKQKLVVSWSMTSDRKTFADMYCDFSNTDLRETIKNITCPALVLLEDYFKQMKSTIDAQYKHLKTRHLEYADKGLHFIMYDDRAWYLNQLHAFVKPE